MLCLSCSNLLFCCCDRIVANRKWFEKGVSFTVCFQVGVYHWGKVRAETQDRNMEAGTESETLRRIAYWNAFCNLLGLLYSKI